MNVIGSGKVELLTSSDLEMLRTYWTLEDTMHKGAFLGLARRTHGIKFVGGRPYESTVYTPVAALQFATVSDAESLLQWINETVSTLPAVPAASADLEIAGYVLMLNNAPLLAQPATTSVLTIRRLPAND